MNAICFKCGTAKRHPLDSCQRCQSLPRTENEVVLSIALSTSVTSPEDLVSLAHRIKNGQGVAVPAEIRQRILVALMSAGAQKSAPPPRKMGTASKWAIAVGIALVAFVWFHPWPSYQWASYKDTAEGYENFIERFPGAALIHPASERIRKLREDEIWAKASGSADVTLLRDYVSNYHDGKYITQARNKLREIADAKWPAISQSRSELEIRKFIKENRETSKRAEADALLEALYDDYEWVRGQDSLFYYKRLAERFPKHPKIDSINKRIIDLEVKKIASGKYGELPQAEAISLGGTEAHVEVKNNTGYELTVLYSGPDSKKLVLAIGDTKTVTLPPGNYQVAASVSAADVRNFYGKDSLRGGRYAGSFYIERKYGGSSLFNPLDIDIPTSSSR